jgi:hypothetical protein
MSKARRTAGNGTAVARTKAAIEGKTLAKKTAKPKGRSLHIGLNSVAGRAYGGWTGPLAACEFDAKDMAAIAASKGMQSTVLLTRRATRAALFDALRDAAKALRTTKPGTPAFQAAQKSAGEAMRGLGGYRPPTRALRDSVAVGDAFAHAAPCKRPGV